MTPPFVIAVGVDGSADSHRALSFTADLAQRTGGEVVAVHALGLLAHTGGEPVVPPPGHRHEVETKNCMMDWSRPLADAEVRYRSLVLDGPPIDVLRHAAESEGATVLIVGRRGSGSSSGLLIGSTSQQLVHQSDIPVVVVP